MPIKIPDNLPAGKQLEQEDIFLMDETHAYKQDIRPLKIALLNLMPRKQVTEEQILRLIGNTPLQVEVTLLYMETHEHKHTSLEYFTNFYTPFADIEGMKFDGLIITGAPVEQMPFEEVSYWAELTKILSWCDKNVNSVMSICWGAQAALYYYYGIPKYPLDKKMFGVFPHKKCRKGEILMRGFDEIFFTPHSRHTEIHREDILKIPNLKLLAESEESGVCIVANETNTRVFITGHPEYDPITLKEEYERDLAKNLPIEPPKHYFEDDDPAKSPVVRWRAHAHIFFANWLNYCVYQTTPYDISKIGHKFGV
ncbi:homoserine O-succinyltransferase [Clostridia bacterium]|nr:homoserine O-succinyltransferase [Clostridia bacterium]